MRVSLPVCYAKMQLYSIIPLFFVEQVPGQ